MTIQWQALWDKRAIAQLGATRHAVPVGSTKALCGRDLKATRTRQWITPPDPQMPRHTACLAKLAELHETGCPETGKVRFATQAAAFMAITDAKIKRVLRSQGHRREDRTYWCDQCNGWHLTSKKGREAS